VLNGIKKNTIILQEYSKNMFNWVKNMSTTNSHSEINNAGS